MKKITFIFLFITTISFSQETREIGNFIKVTSFDRIDVLLIPSNENKIILDGSGSEDVEIVNKNGELKIRMPLTKILSGDAISATVYFTELEAVEANEGSRIACEDEIETNIFDIIAKEGSQVKLILNTEKLTTRTANGSTVEVIGNANNQEVIVNSGGIFEGQNLKTMQTTVTTNAGGEAAIFATNLVDAKTRAGGTITIYGNPKQINEKKIAGGTIRQAK